MSQNNQNVETAVRNVLQNMLGGEDSGGMGFVDPGGGPVHYVFLSRDQFDHGHMLEDAENGGEPTPIPLPDRAMRGYLQNVQYFTKTSDFGTSEKLRVDLNTGDDGVIMIETGFYTNTAKALLPCLAEVNPDQPVTVIPDPSDGESAKEQKVLFVNVLQNGEAVMADWPDSDDDVINYFDIVREQVLGLDKQDEHPSSRGSAGGAAGNGAPQPGNRRTAGNNAGNNAGNQAGGQGGGGRSAPQPAPASNNGGANQPPQSPPAGPPQGNGGGNPQPQGHH
jgi:hypothetical protein